MTAGNEQVRQDSAEVERYTVRDKIAALAYLEVLVYSTLLGIGVVAHAVFPEVNM